jgi:hypothetical protein
MAISRTTLASSLVVLAALVPLAGCGHTATTGATTAATSTPSARATPASTAPPGAPGGTAGCARVRLAITNVDNNKTLCVTTGTIISVFLHGTLSDKWTAIRSGSALLTPHVDPAMTLQVGVTGASFEAFSPGTAMITSARNASHFQVTLDIRKLGVMGR